MADRERRASYIALGVFALAFEVKQGTLGSVHVLGRPFEIAR